MAGNNMSVRVFLPCRKGSERVKKKNIKPFAGYEYGLIEIKLRQLLSVDLIEEVVLSTNDDEILDYAATLNDVKLRLHKRSEELSSSSTSTDELVALALSLIPEGDILWTHVTSPFLNSDLYSEIIKRYNMALSEGFDSLMTTTVIHGFIWNDKGPMNYDRGIEKWPRTQTIAPVHEINSGVFLNSAENYRNHNDRIGLKPFLFPLDKIHGFDIDWEEDFRIAQVMVQAGVTDL